MLHAEVTRLPEQRLGIVVEVFAVPRRPDVLRFREQAGQHALVLYQRRCAQVEAIEVQEIEDVVGQANGTDSGA